MPSLACRVSTRRILMATHTPSVSIVVLLSRVQIPAILLDFDEECVSTIYDQTTLERKDYRGLKVRAVLSYVGDLTEAS